MTVYIIEEKVYFILTFIYFALIMAILIKKI